MNTKTEKPKYFGPKTEKPIEKIAKTAKPKITMPPQCVRGSIPGPSVICGLSLLVLYSAPRGFFSGYSSFPLSSKTNI